MGGGRGEKGIIEREREREIVSDDDPLPTRVLLVPLPCL